MKRKFILFEKEKKKLSYNVRYYKMIRENNYFFPETLI